MCLPAPRLENSICLLFSQLRADAVWVEHALNIFLLFDVCNSREIIQWRSLCDSSVKIEKDGEEIKRRTRPAPMPEIKTRVHLRQCALCALFCNYYNISALYIYIRENANTYACGSWFIFTLFHVKSVARFAIRCNWRRVFEAHLSNRRFHLCECVCVRVCACVQITYIKKFTCPRNACSSRWLISR